MDNALHPSSGLQGLSAAEAAARFVREGANELPTAKRRTPLRIVVEVMREPMLALLVGAGVIYLALGDIKDASILLVFACLSVLITVVQEARTEKVLEALRDLTSPHALVIRDGERKRVAAREVVPGDLIVFAEGDRVAADARLVEARDMQADESLLTGESVPVRKSAAAETDPNKSRPGGDDLPLVFAGSLIVSGSGIGETIATGVKSEIGQIGQSLQALETATPRLKVQTRKLVLLFALVGGTVSLSVVILYGLLRGGWLDAILAGIAVGMSMLPAEFPVVLTVFMTMGAWRISKARVLTRGAAAIETLGAATVLCTDKTGTLTENRMKVAEMRLPDGVTNSVGAAADAMPEPFQTLIRCGVLASAPEPHDPMEKALHALDARDQKTLQAMPDSTWSLVRRYALRPDLLAMSQVWSSGSGRDNLFVSAKGAPEAIASLCHMEPEGHIALTRSVDAMAATGLRVLGVARATFANADLPDSQKDFAFQFVGLVGFADPLRQSVPAAVGECRSAGIKVIMITGDYPATAREIARQAGIGCSDLVTGDELERLSDEVLAARVRTATIFARIMPEQKLRIVKALQSNGEIVAMTGDGVNDAPSLKAADIGVAMGGRGTDVAREASAIVLLDDDFGSIVTTVRLGRRIYDNLRKAMSFIFAVHVPIAGLALLPLVFGLPILFGPIHIAFLQLVIDPVCSLVFEAEPEEEDVMRRPPRAPAEPLFSGSMIIWGLSQGALVLALVSAIFLVALQRGMPANEVRALTFFSLVISIVALIFVNRSNSASIVKAFWRPNNALAFVLPVVSAMLALSLLWQAASGLFGFGPLHAGDLALTVGAGAVVLIVLELAKALRRVMFANRLNTPSVRVFTPAKSETP